MTTGQKQLVSWEPAGLAFSIGPTRVASGYPRLRHILKTSHRQRVARRRSTRRCVKGISDDSPSSHQDWARSYSNFATTYWTTSHPAQTWCGATTGFWPDTLTRAVVRDVRDRLGSAAADHFAAWVRKGTKFTWNADLNWPSSEKIDGGSSQISHGLSPCTVPGSLLRQGWLATLSRELTADRCIACFGTSRGNGAVFQVVGLQGWIFSITGFWSPPVHLKPIVKVPCALSTPLFKLQAIVGRCAR